MSSQERVYLSVTMWLLGSTVTVYDDEAVLMLHQPIRDVK